MAEKFEVTLVANDQMGAVLDSTADKVKYLADNVQVAQKGLGEGLAGKDAQSGLAEMDKRFSSLADSVKKNVQYIGDMVPPLKNVGALSGKLGAIGRLGMFGGIPAATVGVVANQAKKAQNLEVLAQVLGTTVEKLTMMAGAFRIVGVGADDAYDSLTSLSKTFNDVIHGRGNGNEIMSQLAALGFDYSMIPTRETGYGKVVDIEKLLPALDNFIDGIADPQIRHEVAKALNFDGSLEKLFRFDTSVIDLYTRAHKLGYVQVENTTKSLTDFGKAVDRVTAAAAGRWEKTINSLSDAVLGGGGLTRFTNDLADVVQYDDFASLGQILRFQDADGSRLMRIIHHDPDRDEFIDTLPNLRERNQVRANIFTSMKPEWLRERYIDFKKKKDPNFKNPFEPSPMYNTGIGSVDHKRAYLDFLAMAEGTHGKGDDGYNILYGGKTFDNEYSAHPNVRQPFRQTDGTIKYTTAAGRYQITKSTYDEFAPKLGITDFSPKSQDRIAWAIIQKEKAAQDILSGDYDSAHPKLGGRWASLYSSPHLQNKHSLEATNKFMQQAKDANTKLEPVDININITNEKGKTQQIKTKSGGKVTVAMDKFDPGDPINWGY